MQESVPWRQRGLFLYWKTGCLRGLRSGLPRALHAPALSRVLYRKGQAFSKGGMCAYHDSRRKLPSYMPYHDLWAHGILVIHSTNTTERLLHPRTNESPSYPGQQLATGFCVVVSGRQSDRDQYMRPESKPQV